MAADKRSSEHLMRLIDELGDAAGHSDEESREALRDAGIDPDGFVRAVRDRVDPMLSAGRRPRAVWDVIRACAMGVAAASAAVFVGVFYTSSRASVEAERQLARAQLISPLLPALSSDDPDRRSAALVLARQIDPAFAAETATRLTAWDASRIAESRANHNAVYASRILAGLEKLELSRDPDDRKAAIWDDLLPVLLEARKNRDDFLDVAVEYQRVLPLLRVRNPDVFLDSYWGELWILNILLESRIAPVVEAARQQAPDPAVVEQIFQQHAPGLPERDRKAFGEAVSVYASTFKSLR